MTSHRPPGRHFSTAVHIVVALLLAACGGERADDPGAAADTTESAAAFRVALLTPGPISDQSWNGGAYQGLMRIRDSLGAQVSHIQTRTPAEFEENFRQYGAQGYALVFGHGFEFQDAALRVAPDYPRTTYVVTSGNRTAPNVAAMIFGFEDASFLAGMVAGGTTKSNVLGVIGGTELPPVRSSFEAFEAGARAVNPSVRVVTAYIGNWDDVSAGKEQAIAQIARGVDIIFQNADAAGLGIFQAARERPGVYVFGTNANQNDVAPEVILGSVVIDLPRAFLTVAREVRQGGFTGRILGLGAAQGVVRYEPNARLAHLLDARTRAVVDSVGALLAAGRFEPPTKRFGADTAAR